MKSLPTQPAAAPANRVLSIAAVAAFLDVSSKTVRRWVDSGDLPHHRLGRQIKVTQQDLNLFMALRRQVGKGS